MDLYSQYKKELAYCENNFDENNFEYLKKMADIYFKLEQTNFHDLSDAIELWFYEKGELNILNYLKSRRGVYVRADALIEIIENKFL